MINQKPPLVERLDPTWGTRCNFLLRGLGVGLVLRRVSTKIINTFPRRGNDRASINAIRECVPRTWPGDRAGRGGGPKPLVSRPRSIDCPVFMRSSRGNECYLL